MKYDQKQGVLEVLFECSTQMCPILPSTQPILGLDQLVYIGLRDLETAEMVKKYIIQITQLCTMCKRNKRSSDFHARTRHIHDNNRHRIF